MSQRIVGLGKVFVEGPDGKLIEVENPNNPLTVIGVQKNLSGKDQTKARRAFAVGQRGKSFGRSRKKLRSRVQAMDLELERQKRRTDRDFEEERRARLRPEATGRSR